MESLSGCGGVFSKSENVAPISGPEQPNSGRWAYTACRRTPHAHGPTGGRLRAHRLCSRPLSHSEHVNHKVCRLRQGSSRTLPSIIHALTELGLRFRHQPLGPLPQTSGASATDPRGRRHRPPGPPPQTPGVSVTDSWGRASITDRAKPSRLCKHRTSAGSDDEPHLSRRLLVVGTPSTRTHKNHRPQSDRQPPSEQHPVLALLPGGCHHRPHRLGLWGDTHT